MAPQKRYVIFIDRMAERVPAEIIATALGLHRCCGEMLAPIEMGESLTAPSTSAQGTEL